MRRSWEIRQATTKELDAVRVLFAAYQQELSIDLSFQNFEDELRQLPGCYAGPQGAIFLGYPVSSSEASGCIAVRPLQEREKVCEFKRMFVYLSCRGRGLSALLLESALCFAQQVGYRSVQLDTLSTMKSAEKLYRRYGFQDIEPYYDNPFVGTVFLGRSL